MRMALVVLVLVGCGGAQPASGDRDHVEEFVEEDDRCHLVQRYCAGSADEDGCPDLEIAITGPGCVLEERESALLDEGLRDVASEPRIERAVLRVPSTCVALVLERIRAAGVDARVRVEGQDGLLAITAETEQWDGHDCATDPVARGD